MKHYIVPVIFTLIAFVLFVNARSAIHEIEASITLLIAVVMFCTNRVCALLEPRIAKLPVSETKRENGDWLRGTGKPLTMPVHPSDREQAGWK
jgi:Mn2+/Fe2+ NRAMP family transporter